MASYGDFRILTDDASPTPELGFFEYATALSEIIRDSEPEVAVGIFGTWGTGKTTLMRQIERTLESEPGVVAAWFTAWRYEKEDHLIVPLVDVLREALDSEAKKGVGPSAGPARLAAKALGRAGRAFLAGLTLSAKLPGIEASFSPSEVLASLETKDDEGVGALSFYHAAFLMLRDAIEQFSNHGERRVVIFIDDLDRCFPSNALDVLESMKLFFDVPGCVFVVGLDQAVAERAVSLKYKSNQDDPSWTPITGVDYLKKIFQVPFALPRVGTDQLGDYLGAIGSSSGFSQAQAADFANVADHLRYLPDEDSVNPREIKRLVNAYVLQLKMLHLRLGDSLDPNIVLALQCLSFRPDWRPFYEQIAADPALFQQAMRTVLNDEDAQEEVWISGSRLPLPNQLLQYFRSIAAPVISNMQLASYVSAAESLGSTDPRLLEAQAAVGRIRVVLGRIEEAKDLAPDRLDALGLEISRLRETSYHRSGQARLDRALSTLEQRNKDLHMGRDDSAGATVQTVARIGEALDIVEEELRELRRTSNLGAYAS